MKIEYMYIVTMNNIGHDVVPPQADICAKDTELLRKDWERVSM